MSHANLLSSLSSERRGIVHKINNEMRNDANVNSEGESRKDYVSLVKKNKELSDNEKEYCK